MSLPITETMRNSITIALMNHRFEKEQAALRKRQHDLTMKMYRLRYSPADRKRISSIPSGWLMVSSKITVSNGGNTQNLFATESFPIPAVDNGKTFCLNKLKDGDAAWASVVDYMKASEALRRTMEDTRKSTNAALRGFRTLHRLLEAWPEVKVFTDKLGYEANKKALPCVIPGELNKSLGLPAEAASA